MNKNKKASPDAQKSRKGYIILNIIDSRINENGVKEYLLNLIGYEDNATIWESEKNLSCISLIKAYEADKAAKDTEKNSEDPRVEDNTKIKDEKTVKGFERGLQPEKIVAATYSLGPLMFLIKWYETDELDLVPAVEAKVKCPQLVIKFYEDWITFSPHSSDKNDSF